MNKTDRLDALLTIAIREVILEDWEAMTSAQGIQPVSRRCGDRMERILSGKAKKRGTVGKIGIGILVALTAFALLGMAIPPVREVVINSIITWYDTNFSVRYEVETDEPIPTKIEEAVLPARLPVGWTIETEASNRGMVSFILSDNAGETILLTQVPINSKSEGLWFNNDGVSIETVLLNGTTEAYLFSYPDGSCDLIWTDRYVFVLSWYSETADSAVLLRIAESMN